MLCGKAPAVLLRSDDLEGFVIPEHGKNDVADLMHDSAHRYRLFLAGTLPGVIVVNHRIHRRAAPFINFYVIERDHVKDPSGKAGATFGHMDFIAIEFSRLFDSGEAGRVFRVKGFYKEKDQWYEVNATKKKTEIRAIDMGQSVLIVIGENLQEEWIRQQIEFKTGCKSEYVVTNLGGTGK